MPAASADHPGGAAWRWGHRTRRCGLPAKGRRENGLSLWGSGAASRTLAGRGALQAAGAGARLGKRETAGGRSAGPGAWLSLLRPSPHLCVTAFEACSPAKPSRGWEAAHAEC